jgi:hypothetical protein
VKVSYHAGGAVRIEGHLDDPKVAVRLLEHAIDAIKAQHKERPLLVIPNRDVDLPTYPHAVKPLGDMAPRDRGDQ